MNRRIDPKPESVIEWEAAHRRCFLCGAWWWQAKGGSGLATHHIQRRSSCFRPYRDWPENLIRACYVECHAEIESWPHAKQLALKFETDPCGHKSMQSFLDAWHHCRDGEVLKARNRVTVSEVLEWSEKAA